MAELERIIFVGRYGTSREPMAMGILKDLHLLKPVEVLARGIVVQFPEPMNPKAEAVLISNGISLPDYVAEPIKLSEITEQTLVLCMEEKNRQMLVEAFPEITAEHVQVLSFYVGDELEILDPYGGSVQTYGLCFESLKKSIKKLVEMLNEEETLWRKKLES